MKLVGTFSKLLGGCFLGTDVFVAGTVNCILLWKLVCDGASNKGTACVCACLCAKACVVVYVSLCLYVCEHAWMYFGVTVSCVVVCAGVMRVRIHRCEWGWHTRVYARACISCMLVWMCSAYALCACLFASVFLCVFLVLSISRLTVRCIVHVSVPVVHQVS